MRSPLRKIFRRLFPRCFGAGIALALALAGCSRPNEISDGVQLVLNSDAFAPTTTFELRFDEPVVSPQNRGLAAPESPLLITPPVAGSFVWLSQRTGVFTPTEPTVLDTPYRFTLRPHLQNADGRPLRARLQRVLRTPPLSVMVFDAHNHDPSNAPAWPQIKLQFNAAVRAADARSFLEFHSRDAGRIGADVRQANEQEYFPTYQAGQNSSPLTWKQQFHEARPELRPRISSDESAPSAAEVPPLVPHRLIVAPAQPLPVGQDWKLVLAKGLPSAEDHLRLPANVIVKLGRVIPFTVENASPQNHLVDGKSIALFFSKPISSNLGPTNLANWISVSPRPPNFSAENSGSSGVLLRGAFALHKAYTVVLRAGFPAEEPFTLARPYTNRITFEPIPPRLYWPTFANDQLADGGRQFPLLALNVPQVRLRAKLLDRHTLVHALRAYGSYFKHEWNTDEPYREVDFNVLAGKTIFETERRLENHTDESEKLALNWDRILGGRQHGAVFLVAEQLADDYFRHAKLGTASLVQLTDLGLLWKKSPDETAVYVFSHATGKPVANAIVRLLDNDNESLSEKTTDARGLAVLPAVTKAHWLMAESGDDLHALKLTENQMHLYSFNLNIDWSQSSDPRKLFLFSDRSVYRPGETLHLKAILREWTPTGLQLSDTTDAQLRCYDAKGQVFFETNLPFSELGSLSASVPLPQSVRGQYRAELTTDQQAFSHRFEVQEFKPNAFEISIKTKESYAAGEPIAIPVMARYYLGKTLSRAKVSWSWDASDTHFSPADFQDYGFGDFSNYDDPSDRGQTSEYLQGQDTFTDKTNFVLAPKIALNPKAPQPREVRLRVEMTDLNQQTVSHLATFTRHSSDFYLGIKQFKGLVRAGEPLPVQIIAVRADGKPWPEPVPAATTLRRLEWHTIRVQGAGRTAGYRHECVITNIVAHDLNVLPVKSAQQAAAVSSQAAATTAQFIPTETGQYLLETKTKDAAGRDVITTVGFYVASEDEVAWDYKNAAHVELVADQKIYQPGQTAILLIKTPISGEALVTVEREKILRSFVTSLTGNAPTVRIPLEPADAPNVFVSVILVRGSAHSLKKFKMPECRVGYCQLKVENPENQLQVMVNTDATDHQPGETVPVTSEIKDARAQPVPGAEVTLYAVDEGILSLTGYETPDPGAFFFQPRPLSVHSFMSLPNLVPEDPAQLSFHNKGYLVGGGGELVGRVRKNFLACAFWNATLHTDRSGKVSASFVAPDNLTRYRIIAVAHNARSQFGNGQSAVQINKPLMIDPALPRFANATDRLLARAVVHNQTDGAGEVHVTLKLDKRAKALPELGFTNAVPPLLPLPEREGRGEGGSRTNVQILSQQLAISAKGSVVVEFPVAFVEPGVARWTWTARFAQNSKLETRNSKLTSFADSVESTLPVGYPVPLLREIHLARVNVEATNLLAAASPQLLAGEGTVTVTLANTRLSELAEATRQLLHYPYGCVEQTSSSLLPWIVLRNVPALQPCLLSTGQPADQAIRAGLQRLFSMQTSSGGFSYWPGGTEPMLWGSAYGGMVVTLAKRGGARVPEVPFDHLLTYLSQQMRGNADRLDDYQLSEHCLALYTLALAGKPEPAYQEMIFQKRESLSAEDRVLLALAILESQGPAPMVKELLKPRTTAAAAGNDWFACDERDLALQLLAWVLYQPANPAVDVLVAELMRSQKQAHWGTTQGNAWGLYALTEYAQRVESKNKATDGTITWGTHSEPFHLAETTAASEHVFTLSSKLAQSPLAIANPSKNLLFAQVTIEARPPVVQQPRQDRGFSLQRTYARLDDNGQPQELKGLRVGDRVLVTLQFSAQQPAHFLAIDDPLPALFEAVNPVFKSQQTRLSRSSARMMADTENFWTDFREMRHDRLLYFRDHLPAGSYTIRYLARVRAAGAATAPAAKVEAMYHPDRFGLSDTVSVTSLPLE